MSSVYGPMTLGELIDELKGVQRRLTDDETRERHVFIDWNRLSPCGFHSYRGYYDHLAIDFSTDAPSVSLAAFIAEAEAQVGAVHYGYKGGHYTMKRDTPVWVARPDSAAGWGVAEVRDDGWCAVLVTRDFD